jgi:hypothetical protein
LDGIRAWIDNDRKERRTFHTNGDGTFVVDGNTINLRNLMEDKVPSGFDVTIVIGERRSLCKRCQKCEVRRMKYENETRRSIFSLLNLVVNFQTSNFTL